MRWTFEREARWMLGVSLIPVIGILLVILWTRVLRLFG